ncbi:MAG: hypothetical protein ACI4KF_00145 [Huintestinicola sp.]
MKKSKLRYYISILCIFLGAGMAVYVGSSVVTVNCHNAMYSDKMEMFSWERDNDSRVLTVFGEEYRFGE